MQRFANCLLSCALALVATSAVAEFHTFQIEQMFSSADGTIQFVVLHESAGMNGENKLGGHTFTSTSGAAVQNFTFNVDLPGGGMCGYYGCSPSPTAFAHVLIATQGFAQLGKITPDYVVPNGFLPLTNGTLNYAGVDQVTYATLPTDGVSALDRSGATVQNLAMNFAGQSVSVTVATVLDLDQHGLTGSWYQATTSGQGFEVEVYPDLSPGSGLAQVSWFTFDIAAGGEDHERWYTASGPVTSGAPSAALTIYQNTGGNFNAAPMTTAQAVGTATLSFASCTSGQLAYSFTDGSGRSGSIPLTRLTQNVTCGMGAAPFSTNTDFAHSGNWYDATTAGQGFVVEVNPTSATLFAAWYTYAPMGAAAGAAGQRWYTAQASFTAGMRSIPVTIYETTGGIFNTTTPAGQKTTAVGTGTLAFQSCAAATFNYTFTGGASMGMSGTINLSRVGPVPPGCTS
jgi:hypothetical protein